MRKILLALAIVACTAFIYQEPGGDLAPMSCIMTTYARDSTVADLFIMNSCHDFGDEAVATLDHLRRNGI